MSLSITLTEEELTKVESKQKNIEKLPSFFDAGLRANVQISRDFEAFLILSEDPLKTSAIDWIKKAVTIQKVNKDRDDLVALALTQEKANSDLKIAALDQKLTDFNTFRTTFQANPEFAGVPELQRFLFDLQRVVEELASARDRAQFDGTTSQVIQRGNDRLAVSDQEIEELQSWTGVLSAYLQG